MFVFLLVFHAFCRAESEKVFHFDPSVVELVGKIETQTFPGPPGYESILHGDKIERGWYLRLPEPITVKANDPTTDLGWKTEMHVRVLHMVVDWDHVKEKILAQGETVKIIGKLFNRQNGHHHSRVMIEVSELYKVAE